jgi:hypothetical protein
MTLRNEGPVELLLLLSWPERERGQRPAALVPFGSRDSKESQPEESIESRVGGKNHFMDRGIDQ